MIEMPQFADMIEQRVGADRVDSIVEVGSHDGRDAAYLKARFPQARALAIEGDPEFYQGHRPAGVDWVQAVIAAESMPVEWHHQLQLPMASSLYRYADPTFAEREPVTVQAQRLDELLIERRMLRPTVLKIDVEGATYDILSSLGTLIGWVRIMHIETETQAYWNGQRLEPWVNALLTRTGFREIAREGGPGQWDVVWART